MTATNLLFKDLVTGTVFALNPTHLYKMKLGVSSLYPADNLVNMALGYAAAKTVKNYPGDAYSRWSQVERGDGACSPGDKVESLVGPTTPISSGQKRVLLVRMGFVVQDCHCPELHTELAPTRPKCGTRFKRVDKMAHLIYDNKGAVLTDGAGNSLYIDRSHMVMDPEIAKIEL